MKKELKKIKEKFFKFVPKRLTNQNISIKSDPKELSQVCNNKFLFITKLRKMFRFYFMNSVFKKIRYVVK